MYRVLFPLILGASACLFAPDALVSSQVPEAASIPPKQPVAVASLRDSMPGLFPCRARRGCGATWSLSAES
jgi:hypothetical protein